MLNTTDNAKQAMDAFRNAKTSDELIEASQNIVALRDQFSDTHLHFLLASENVMDKVAKKEPVDPVRDKSLDIDNAKTSATKKQLSKAQFDTIIDNINKGNTQSLQSANDLGLASSLRLSGDNNQVGLTILRNDYQSYNPAAPAGAEDFLRATKGIMSFLNNAAKNAPETQGPSSQELNALGATIVNKYPLVMHLIDPNPQKDTLANDRANLLQFGSDLSANDKDYINRWKERTALKAEFSKKMDEFIKNGDIKDPQKVQEFEKYLQDTSKKVADMYTKDISQMPDKKVETGKGNTKIETDRTYTGKKTKQQVIDTVKSHVEGLGKENYLSSALEKAKTQEVTKPITTQTQPKAQPNAKDTNEKTGNQAPNKNTTDSQKPDKKPNLIQQFFKGVQGKAKEGAQNVREDFKGSDQDSYTKTGILDGIKNLPKYMKSHPVQSALIIGASVVIGAALIAATVLTGGAAIPIAAAAVGAVTSIAIGTGAITANSLTQVRKGIDTSKRDWQLPEETQAVGKEEPAKQQTQEKLKETEKTNNIANNPDKAPAAKDTQTPLNTQQEFPALPKIPAQDINKVNGIVNDLKGQVPPQRDLKETEPQHKSSVAKDIIAQHDQQSKGTQTNLEHLQNSKGSGSGINH